MREYAWHARKELIKILSKELISSLVEHFVQDKCDVIFLNFIIEDERVRRSPLPEIVQSSNLR